MVWQVGDGPDSPSMLDAPDGPALDVSTFRARATDAAWRLLRASGKPTDGWLSRHVHRKISRLFSYLFLLIGLSANLATFLTFGVGVVASWLMARTSHATMIAGSLLFWFASIADGVDGEMARLTLTESAWGEQLDTAVDHATHLMGFGGVLVGWWRQGIGPYGAALAIVVAAGIPGVLLWAMALVRRALGDPALSSSWRPSRLSSRSRTPRARPAPGRSAPRRGSSCSSAANRLPARSSSSRSRPPNASSTRRCSRSASRLSRPRS